MSKLSKKQKENIAKFDKERLYPLEEAVNLLGEMKHAKFCESVDINMRLGVDPKKAEQTVRGTVALPNGTGKTVKTLVFATGADADAAKEAGADFVGFEDLVEKIKGGWTDFDIAIASPATMREVGKLGRILGPRGLMPAPKAGTVTPDVSKAVSEFKAGKVEFRVDKQAGIHCCVGKIDFGSEKLLENINTFLDAINKAKPAASKGTYLQKISLSTTMGPGVHIDTRGVEKGA